MADKDTVTKEYMQDKAVFADIFNFYLHGGEQVIKPGQLKPLDTTALSLPYGDDDKTVPVQKYRDVLKMVTAMSDGHAAYLILGIENQSQIHYAMPIRNMLYDALQYAAQVDEIAKSHRKNKDKADRSDEFLSGFYITDKLLPVITLTILWNGSEWTAPRSLFEMLDINDNSVLKYMSDYKLNIIAPAEISDDELDKLNTELGIALKYVKHSLIPEELDRLIHDDPRYKNVSRNTIRLLKIVMGIDINIDTGEEEFNMCEALEGLMKRSEAKGRSEGIMEGRAEGRIEGRAEGRIEGRAEGRSEGILETLASLVKDGLISLAEAAKRSNMTVSEFEDKTGLKA